jgi:hypothetical protein
MPSFANLYSDQNQPYLNISKSGEPGTYNLKINGAIGSTLYYDNTITLKGFSSGLNDGLPLF